MPADDRPGRIAFVLAGLGAGGAERVIAMLASACADTGHDVLVVSFDQASDPIYHDFDPRIRLLRLGTTQRGPWSAVRRVFRLRAALQRERPDTVVSFLTKINVISLLATIGLGLRVIVSERNNPALQSSHFLWPWLLARLYPRAAAVVLQTEASRSCLPRSVADAAIVIPNPIAISNAVRGEAGSSILAAVGRLEHQKGFDLLIAAFSKLAGQHPGWQLCIWGEGPRRADLEAQIADLGLADRIKLPGLSDVPGGWLASAEAFVLSSRHEGFPNVLGEAMAAGLAVAAFDCDFGPAELIDNDRNGLLVNNGDVAAMSEALDRMLSDAALRRRLGTAAQATTRTYAPAEIFARWQAVFRSA